MSSTTTRRSRPPEQYREGLAVWRVFLEAHGRVMEALERDLQERVGLPFSWFEVLLRLDHVSEGELRMQDLAQRVLLSKSGMTRLVDRIEAAGLIERRSCPMDRRGTYAALTNEGREKLRHAQPFVLEAIHQRFVHHLTPEEAEALSSALTKVLKANGFVLEQGPYPHCRPTETD